MSNAIRIPKCAEKRPKGIHKRLLDFMGFDSKHGGESKYHVWPKKRERSTYFYCIVELLFALVSVYSLIVHVSGDLQNLSWTIIAINVFRFIMNFARLSSKYIETAKIVKSPPAANQTKMVKYNVRYYTQVKWHGGWIIAIIVTLIAVVIFSLLNKEDVPISVLVKFIKWLVLWAAIIEVASLACWNIIDALHELWGYQSSYYQVSKPD